MRRVEEVTVFDPAECDLLFEALTCYETHLHTIEASCKKPVLLKRGQDLRAEQAMLKQMKKAVYARTTQGRARLLEKTAEPKEEATE